MSSTAQEAAITSSALTALPTELLHQICDHLHLGGQLKSLATLLSCSRYTYDLCSSYLYKRVTLTRNNSASFFYGLDIENLERRRSGQPKIMDRIGPDGKSSLDPWYTEQWTKLYGENPHLFRQQYLVWPDGDIEQNDDVDQGVEGDWKAMKAWKDRLAVHTYPKSASHIRKIALLGKVRHLTIAEAPSPLLSYQLEAFILNRQVMLEGLNHLIIGPKAFWTFANYTDFYHGLQHPFYEVCSTFGPTSICIQLPIVDDHLVRSFQLPRHLADHYWPEAPDLELYDNEEIDDDDEVLLFALRGILKSSFARMIRGIGQLSVTIHNVVELDGYCLYEHNEDRRYRIFLRKCPCCTIHGGIIQWINYWCTHGDLPDPLRRHEVLQSLILKAGNRVSEFVDADWIAGPTDSTASGSRINGLEENVWRSVEQYYREYYPEYLQSLDDMKARYTFTNSQDAAPCECCGRKQLSDEESSIKPTGAK